jgi:hypothetical protein
VFWLRWNILAYLKFLKCQLKVLFKAKKIKKEVTCLLSYVEDRFNTNTSIIIHTYKYTQNIFPKVGLLGEMKGGGKKENNDQK